MESTNGSRMECLDLIGNKLPEHELKDKIIKFCLYKGRDSLYIRGMLTLARMNGQIMDTEFDVEPYSDLKLTDMCPELLVLAGAPDICKLCKFSFDYHNDNIHSEYTALSYIFKSKENFKEFKQTGLKVDVFKSYMVFNSTPIPIHRIIYESFDSNYETTRKNLFARLDADYPDMHFLTSDIPLFFRRLYEEDCAIDKFFKAVSTLSGAPCYLESKPEPEYCEPVLDVYEIENGLEQLGLAAVVSKPIRSAASPAQNAVKVRRSRKALHDPPPLAGQETFLSNEFDHVPRPGIPARTMPALAACPTGEHIVPIAPSFTLEQHEPALSNSIPEPMTAPELTAENRCANPLESDPLTSFDSSLITAPAGLLEQPSNTIKLISAEDFFQYLPVIHSQSTLYIESVGHRILVSWGSCGDILEFSITESWAQSELSLIMRSTLEKVSFESMGIRSLLLAYGIPCRNLNGIMTLYHCWRYNGRSASPTQVLKDLTGVSLDCNLPWYNTVIEMFPYYSVLWKSLKRSKIALADFGIYDRESAFESLAATAYTHKEDSPYPRIRHFGYRMTSSSLLAGESSITAKFTNLSELLEHTHLKSPMGYPFDKSRYGEELFRRFGAELMTKDVLGKSKVRLLTYSNDAISLACPTTFYRVLLDILNHTLDARTHDDSPDFRSLIEIE